MRSRPSRFLIPSLLILTAAVVALNAWFGFRAIQSLHDSEYWVAHTWQVINQVESVMSSVKDAETGNRGYLITGEEAYLEPYTVARRELPDKLDQLARLTPDNPIQVHRLTEMRAVLEQRLDLLRQGIDLRRENSRDTVRSMVLSGTGKVDMDHLRRLADEMEGDERHLLAIRTANVEADNHRAHYIIALASALDLLFIVFLFRYFMNERSMRFSAELNTERLARAHAETEAQAEEIRLLNMELERRVRLRTAELEAFSYSVSHDLRAPLRTIDGFSLALEEDYQNVVDETGRDYIRRVRSGVQRMGQLIDALLQLSRITRAEITREFFDMTQLAESVASVLLEENRDRKIDFHIAPDLRIEADPRLVRVALENLLGNAVKFSSKKIEATIDFGWDKEQNAWFVRDNGAGFDMYYAGKLFSAFHRLHGDKDFRGSGIGLATVARIVHRHHGKIWADSVVDHGATFWFTLG